MRGIPVRAVHPFRLVANLSRTLLGEVPVSCKFQVLSIESKRRILLPTSRVRRIALRWSKGKHGGVVVVVVVSVVCFELHTLPNGAHQRVVHCKRLCAPV